jgi:hypothetical protein
MMKIILSLIILSAVLSPLIYILADVIGSYLRQRREMERIQREIRNQNRNRGGTPYTIRYNCPPNNDLSKKIKEDMKEFVEGE